MKISKILAFGAGIVGVGLGYVFHDEIEEFIDKTLDKVLDKVDGDKCCCGCNDDDEFDWGDEFDEDLDECSCEKDCECGLKTADENCFVDDTHTNVVENVSYEGEVAPEVKDEKEEDGRKYVVLD